MVKIVTEVAKSPSDFTSFTGSFMRYFDVAKLIILLFV